MKIGDRVIFIGEDHKYNGPKYGDTARVVDWVTWEELEDQPEIQRFPQQFGQKYQSVVLIFDKYRPTSHEWGTMKLPAHVNPWDIRPETWP